jgi:hypothetical protein
VHFVEPSEASRQGVSQGSPVVPRTSTGRSTGLLADGPEHGLRHPILNRQHSDTQADKRAPPLAPLCPRLSHDSDVGFRFKTLHELSEPEQEPVAELRLGIHGVIAHRDVLAQTLSTSGISKDSDPL